MKFRPRESESESDSSPYTKSELFAEEKLREEVESFKLLIKEEEWFWSGGEFTQMSISVGGIEGGDEVVVVGKVVVS